MGDDLVVGRVDDIGRPPVGGLHELAADELLVGLHAVEDVGHLGASWALAVRRKSVGHPSPEREVRPITRASAARANSTDCYRRSVVDYCPRCGARGSVRFCYLCSDGEADEARAQELVDAWSAGNPLAMRLLEDVTDPRAYDVVVAAAADADRPDVRRSALIALGGIADPRGIPVATAALQDPDDPVRAAAIGALAEMGPGGADAIAARLADPRDRVEAARALAWLHDERAFEPLALILDSDTVVANSVFGGGTIAAMGRLGGPAAVEVLGTVAGRVIAAADAGAPDWQVRTVGSTVAQTLIDMRDPTTEPIQDALVARFGRLYVMPADPAAPLSSAGAPASHPPSMVVRAARRRGADHGARLEVRRPARLGRPADLATWCGWRPGHVHGSVHDPWPGWAGVPVPGLWGDGRW